MVFLFCLFCPRTSFFGTLRNRHSVKQSVFNTHPHLLNVGNGVVGLHTGILSPHDSGLMMSTLVKSEYHSDINFANTLFGCERAQRDGNYAAWGLRGAFDLHTAYTKFCSLEGLTPKNSTVFGRQLRERGYKKDRLSACYVYSHIRLKDFDLGLHPDWAFWSQTA